MASPLPRYLSDSITITTKVHTLRSTHPRHRYTAASFPEIGRTARRTAGSGESVIQGPVTHRLPLTAGAIGGRWRPAAESRRLAAPLPEAPCRAGSGGANAVCLTAWPGDRPSGRSGSTVAGQLDQAVVAVTPRRPASVPPPNTAAAAATRGGPDRDQDDPPVRHAADCDHADGADPGAAPQRPRRCLRSVSGWRRQPCRLPAGRI